MLPHKRSFNQFIPLKNEHKIELWIKREDLLHPFISGNKYRKLKYNLEEAQLQNHHTLLTFGGAFSNHIAAVAYAGKISNLNTIGVIRGEELKHNKNLNPTLQFAKNCGMNLYFISRAKYKNKHTLKFQEELKNIFGDFYLIPEGGTNPLAVKGCEEILNEEDSMFDIVCSCVGTGGTISGLINSSKSHQEILGFSVLKNKNLYFDICKFVNQDNWSLNQDFHFGGYAKITDELIQFINDFKKNYHVLLDPVYTAKMMFGVMKLISKGYFQEETKILCVHTGGLQGIKGINQRQKQKNKKLIEN